MTTTSVLPYFAISILLWLVVASWCRCTGAFAETPGTAAGGPAAGGTEAGRYAALDGLRGFLALGVLFHHALFRFNLVAGGRWTIADSAFYTLLGQVAVMAFFMITGFLFWDRVLRRSGPIDWRRFYGARVRRIVPLYLVAVALLLLVVAFETGGRRQVPTAALVEQVLRWLSFSLLDMPDVNALANTKLYIAGVVWTLKYEWAFYGLPPFMALFATGAWFAALACCAVALALAADDALVLCFLGGMLAAHAVNRWPLAPVLRTGAATIVPVALVVTVFASFDDGYGFAQAVLLLAAFFFIAHGNDLFGLLAAPASRALGAISYSVYLLHGLLLYAGFRAAGAIVPMTQLGAAGYWSIVAGVAIATIACSALTYRWIELPFMRARRGGGAAGAAVHLSTRRAPLQANPASSHP